MERIIVGLGNPGGEYERTRHNVGWMILDAIHNTYSFSPWELKKHAESVVATGLIDGMRSLLVKPETYMNESGRAVKKFVKSMKAAESLIVIHDDIDLPLGRWKIVAGRGEAGHNGLRSISGALKTRQYIRVRIGVLPVGKDGKPKKPKGAENVLSFVLGKFSPTERKIVARVSEEVVLILPVLLHKGGEEAMMVFHSGKIVKK